MPHKKKPGVAIVISIGKKPKPDMKKYVGDAMPNAMNKAWDNEKTGKFALEGQKNNLFNKAWAVLKQNKCENCGKETRHLYTNPMQAGQRNTVPSVCRDCVSNIELSDAFYGYYN